MCKTIRGILTALLALIIIAGSLAQLSGCKGNTTSAALPGATPVVPPPTVSAYPVATDIRQADPLQDPTWLHAQWFTFLPPINTTLSTPTTHAAILYDAANLYVAVVSRRTPAVHDTISLFIDTTCSGKQLLEVSCDSLGKTDATWYHSAMAAAPKDDGTPNLAHPLSTIPELPIPGLSTNLRSANINGTDLWTVVLTIPTKMLPQALRTSPSADAHWKVNLIRTLTVPSATDANSLEYRQSNLSQVFQGAQPVSPYRLADLRLLPPPATLPTPNTNHW